MRSTAPWCTFGYLLYILNLYRFDADVIFPLHVSPWLLLLGDSYQMRHSFATTSTCSLVAPSMRQWVFFFFFLIEWLTKGEEDQLTVRLITRKKQPFFYNVFIAKTPTYQFVFIVIIYSLFLFCYYSIEHVKNELDFLYKMVPGTCVYWFTLFKCYWIRQCSAGNMCLRTHRRTI